PARRGGWIAVLGRPSLCVHLRAGGGRAPAVGRGPLPLHAAGRRRSFAPAPPSSRHSTPLASAVRGRSHHSVGARAPRAAGPRSRPAARGSGLQRERVVLVVAGARGELDGPGALQRLVHALPDLFDEVWSGV